MATHPAGPRHADLAAVSGQPSVPADINALTPAIWPRNAQRGEDGVVTIAGVPTTVLAERYGTPLYVYDEADVRQRAQAHRAAWNDSDVFYAGKAFLCVTVARWMHEEGLGIDVATGGELAVALRAGVPGKRILMHGNNKSVAEIAAGVSAGVHRIVIDSYEEIDRVAIEAQQQQRDVDVLVRVTVGVEAHTHEFIATAHEDQKFGFALANGEALNAVSRVLAQPRLRLRGLHSHIGSQIFDADGFAVAAHRLVRLAAQIRDDLGVAIDDLDVGGGVGIAYVDGDDAPDVRDMAKQIREVIARECAAVNLPMPHISIEPGRAIVGPAGVTLYKVGTVKPVELAGGTSRLYVSVDGGMSDNIRTALYGAEYTVRVVNRAVPAGMRLLLARVVGKHCETGDIVVRDCWLPEDLRAGDLLAVAATGAYCRSLASQYNHVPRPAVVAVAAGATRVLLRRETEDDLFALEP